VLQGPSVDALFRWGGKHL